MTAQGYRPNQMYPITTPTGKVHYPPEGRCWSTIEPEFLKLLAQGRIYFGKDNSSQPSIIRYLSEVDGVVPWTWWPHDEVGHTDEAKKEIYSILGKVDSFDTPKPTRLILRILGIASKKDSIILDSFAGSGTTAHAVLNLNKQDGGNRKFILVETEDYAETITAERVKRIIRGYGEGTSAVEGTGGDFSFYELGDVLLLADGNLNESVGVDRIRAYVYFMETKQTIGEKSPEENDYYLGTHNQTAYYFYYEPETATTLDDSFLATIRTRSDGYLIYADRLALSADDLREYNIVFKKIPRDISRL